MGDVSDETLMAFVDGELSPAERMRIEAIIAGSPDLRARMALFDATGRRLSAEFAGALNAPLPQKLVDLVLGHGAGKGGERARLRHAGTIRPPALRDRIARAQSLELPAWQAALATAAVLLVGVGAGAYVSRHLPSDVRRDVAVQAPAPAPLIVLDNGNLVAGGRLAEVLETMPSAVTHALEDQRGARPSATARIRLTFKSQDGYCRQYEVVGTSGESTAEIACRSAQGRWRVVAHSAEVGAQSSEIATRPSAAAGSHIEAAVDELRVGEALGLEEEVATISRLWQR